MTPDPVADLAIITQQEQLLRFTAFNADTAWQLGNILRNKLLDLKAAATIEIDLNGQVLFACTTPGASPGQADWIRRKRNTVRRFARSTYAVGRILERDGETMQARHGLALEDYAAHGGGFPIFIGAISNGIPDTGMVGTIILSGLAQRDDHSLVVTALAELLNITTPTLP
jgi:uncharacterized protein (UPF0303 family)